MKNTKDTKELVNEHKRVLELLYDCHGLMFETQLVNLLDSPQRSVNRLVNKLANYGLVKIIKSGKSHIVSLSRVAAQHLLSLESPPWLADPNTNTATWLGAYAADYLYQYGYCFVLASQYKKAFQRNFDEHILYQQEDIKKQVDLKLIETNAANSVRSQQATEFARMYNYFNQLKSKLPLSESKDLLSKFSEAEKGFLVKAMGGVSLIQDFKSIVEKQQKALVDFDKDIFSLMQSLRKRYEELTTPLQLQQQQLPTLPTIHFPDGASNMVHKSISASDNPSLAMSKLVSRHTLYVELPGSNVGMQDWPGVESATKKTWEFVILDRGYSVGWYKSLLLQIALSKSKHDKVSKQTAYPPKDRIRFKLTILAPNEIRTKALEEKLYSLVFQNCSLIRRNEEQYTFADCKVSGWGLESFTVVDLNTERLFLNSVQNLQPSCDLVASLEQAGAYPSWRS